MTTVTINNKTFVFDGDADTPLLWYLRDEIGLTGTRFGCGAALCGCCTVHVDGEAARSCSITMGDVAGKSIMTIEGLGQNGLHALQKAWLDIDVPQCGYCQSGQLMQAAALLSANADPSDEEIDEAMSGNICRCGTYPRIREAIKQAAKELRTFGRERRDSASPSESEGNAQGMKP
jgi:isoquinoline 1-oxidoreductase subunit alpha